MASSGSGPAVGNDRRRPRTGNGGLAVASYCEPALRSEGHQPRPVCGHSTAVARVRRACLLGTKLAREPRGRGNDAASQLSTGGLVMLSDLLYRLRALFRRNAVEGELDNELRFHFEQQVEKHVKSGLTRAEAVRQARLTLGGIEQMKEECRDARGVRW